MQHRKLDRLMTPVERIARVAAAGLTSATSSATKPSGAKSYDNADGTRTIIGNVANGESSPSYTMATHVGDTTAPGTPTGVTASSKSGVVVVEWDGTLTGGIPDDFYCVRVYLDNVELGILTGAGSVSSASLEGGTTHSVTATAEDDACLPDGTPAHNVSAPTTAISVTVSEGVESVAAIAQEALDVAEATGQHFWSDSDGIHVTEVTQEEWQDSTGTSYHSGQNVLINALGQLFRKGLTHLMALTAGEDETATFTVSETVRDYTLPAGVSVVGKPSITVNGVEPAWDEWEWYPPRTIRYRGFYDHDGEEMVVTYRRSSALSIFNGLGNAAENVMAFFDSRGMTLLDGLGYIGGQTTTYIGEERRDEGGHVIGYNMQDAHSLQFANSSPTVTNALAYTNITATENYQVDTSGNRTGTSTWSPSVSTYVSNGTNNSGVTVNPDNVYISTPTLEVYDRSEYTLGEWTSHQVTQALNCRSNSNGWVNSDGYADSNRAIYIGATVNNSASSMNGHGVSLYAGAAGLNLWDGTAGRTLWNIGITNPNFAVWAGSKVMTINASSFTLLTKAQLQAIVGTSWTPTGSNCAVFVTNGDYGVTDALMTASIDASSVVRVHLNKTHNGPVRVNYLIIRFA